MPLVNGWDGPKDDEEDLDKSLVRTVTCYWEKEFDNNDLKATQAGIDFTDATGIGIGSRWPEFPDCFCVAMKTVWDHRSAAPKRVARVSLTYTNQPDSSASANASVGGPSAAAVQSQQAGRPPAERQSQPLLRRPDVRFNGELRQVFRRYDAAGKLYAAIKAGTQVDLFVGLDRHYPERLIKGSLAVEPVVHFASNSLVSCINSTIFFPNSFTTLT